MKKKIKFFKRARRSLCALRQLEFTVSRFQKMMDNCDLPSYTSDNDIKFRVDLTRSMISQQTKITLRANINGEPYIAWAHLGPDERWPEAFEDKLPELLEQILYSCFHNSFRLGETLQIHESVF